MCREIEKPHESESQAAEAVGNILRLYSCWKGQGTGFAIILTASDRKNKPESRGIQCGKSF
jgi:hypothetical protein